MKLFSWFHHSGKEISAARDESRKSRGILAQKVIELDQQRHLLDEMVAQSLKLLETKK
jgi:hypothetical protein